MGRLNAELVRALVAPDVAEKLAQRGAEASPGTPEAFAALIRDDTARWARLVREAGVRAEP